MPVATRMEKVVTAKNMIRGVRTRFADREFVWLRGKKLTPADVIARFEAQLAAIERVRQAAIAYDVALAAERRLRKPMQELTLDIKRSVAGELGLEAFADFGWKRPGKPGPKTTAAKLAGVQKRAAKRRSG